MSLSTVVAPHLPYLRRFARALTGTQQGGDAYVASMLEALIEDASDFAEDDKNAKLMLYRNLCQLWSALPINVAPEMPGASWESTAQSRLAGLPPRAREAFLLVSVEEFSPTETQSILGIDGPEFDELMEEASRQIAAMITTGVMIIEDEPLIAVDLEDLVTGLGHRVTAMARTRSEAVKLAALNPPGLILSDIQLADRSSGIEAVREITRQFDVPIIFITAYPERLLTGNGIEPAFIITKPFQPAMVKAMISQALFFAMTPGRQMLRTATG